jgi:hypothetical protein
MEGDCSTSIRYFVAVEPVVMESHEVAWVSKVVRDYWLNPNSLIVFFESFAGDWCMSACVGAML